jgi:hypothetical protein
MTTREQYRASGLLPSPPVERITLGDANELLGLYHYLGAVRTASAAFGHSEGCTVWGVMRSRAWHARLVAAGFAPIELIRMVGAPGHNWSTSSLLAKSAKLLSQHDVFVTYADEMQGHSGATYRAANWQELPQRAQPDGWVWRLDGKIVPRRSFGSSCGSQAFDVVKAAYGDRLTRELDVPKRRFYFIRDARRVPEFLAASVKVKTWGASRCKVSA